MHMKKTKIRIRSAYSKKKTLPETPKLEDEPNSGPKKCEFKTHKKSLFYQQKSKTLEIQTLRVEDTP